MLAEFWATALDYELEEPPSELIELIEVEVHTLLPLLEIDDYNCGDFETQEQAQAVLDGEPGIPVASMEMVMVLPADHLYNQPCCLFRTAAKSDW